MKIRKKQIELESGEKTLADGFGKSAKPRNRNYESNRPQLSGEEIYKRQHPNVNPDDLKRYKSINRGNAISPQYVIDTQRERRIDPNVYDKDKYVPGKSRANDMDHYDLESGNVTYKSTAPEGDKFVRDAKGWPVVSSKYKVGE
jgi:hypothetical protein